MSHSVDNHGASHGSVKSYMIGFVLSLILTAVPFWMVMDGSASHAVVLGTVVAMAVVMVVAVSVLVAGGVVAGNIRATKVLPWL